MESKLVEYARAVVEDAVDVDAEFFSKIQRCNVFFEQLCSHNILILLELLFLTF